MLALSAGLPAALAGSKDGFEYPETATVDVVDVLHGVDVADPYRWLEDDARTSAEVAAWVEAQNEVTFGYLESIPEREVIRERLTRLWDYEKIRSPFRVAGRMYYFRNDGLQNQSVLYTVGDGSEEPRVVLDPNGWSEDGTVALAGLSFSDDGRYVAYARAVAGSDWSEWFVHDLERDVALDDHLEWTRDGKGFFYGRFPQPEEGQEFQALNTGQRLYYHRVGTPQSEDVLVYHRPDKPEWGYAPEVTEDGRYLVISVWKGTDAKNRLLVKDLLEPYGMPVTIVGAFENEYDVVGNDGTRFYVKTDVDAPNARVIAMDLRDPGRENWVEIIAERESPLRDVNLVGNQFVCTYLEDARTRVRIHRIDGSHVRDVDFPSIGSASGFGGKRTDTETFYTLSSFNMPPSIYRYDLLTGKSEPWRRTEVDFRPEDYVVRQVFY